MFGYRLETNGFTRGKCIRLYAGYSSSKMRIITTDRPPCLHLTSDLWLTGHESSVRVKLTLTKG